VPTRMAQIWYGAGNDEVPGSSPGARTRILSMVFLIWYFLAGVL